MHVRRLSRICHTLTCSQLPLLLHCTRGNRHWHKAFCCQCIRISRSMCIDTLAERLIYHALRRIGSCFKQQHAVVDTTFRLKLPRLLHQTMKQGLSCLLMLAAKHTAYQRPTADWVVLCLAAQSWGHIPFSAANAASACVPFASQSLIPHHCCPTGAVGGCRHLLSCRYLLEVRQTCQRQCMRMAAWSVQA